MRHMDNLHPKLTGTMEVAVSKGLLLNELPIIEFKKAIRATHRADSTLVNRFRVLEVFQDHPIWDGEVLVFNLLDHLTAKICYAWSVDGRVTAVLHEGPVDSPRNAVRAAIVAEHRTQ